MSLDWPLAIAFVAGTVWLVVSAVRAWNDEMDRRARWLHAHPVRRNRP